MSRRELLEALILLLLDRKKATPAVVSQAPTRTVEPPPADTSVQRIGERKDYRGPESTPVPHQAP